MFVTLSRKGLFQVPYMQHTPHQCGSMETRAYDYEVSIRADADELNPEGFIINNESIQEYFEKKYGTLASPWPADSCENLARVAAREIAILCRNAGTRVLCVECMLLGSNGAEIRARWLAAEDALEHKALGAAAGSESWGYN